MGKVAVFLLRGGNAAMVTDRRKAQPVADRIIADGFHFPVIDGDQSDDRFHDDPGCVVDLYAKGKARNRITKFVQPIYAA
jgi:hypothetical protein